MGFFDLFRKKDDKTPKKLKRVVKRDDSMQGKTDSIQRGVENSEKSVSSVGSGNPTYTPHNPTQPLQTPQPTVSEIDENDENIDPADDENDDVLEGMTLVHDPKELRPILFKLYDEFPHASALDMQSKLTELGFCSEDGTPIIPQWIIGAKNSWVAFQDKVRKVEDYETAKFEQSIVNKERERRMEMETPDDDEQQEPEFEQQPLYIPRAQRQQQVAPAPRPRQQYLPAPQPAPQPIQQPPAAAPFVLPPRPSRLEVLFAQLDQAIKSNNPGLARIVADGIYAEYDKGGGGGGDDKMFTLMSTMVSGMFNKQMTETKNPTAQLRDMVGIMKDLMPPQQQGGESEAVQMTKAVGDIVQHGVGELKDTVLTVTGKKDTSDMFGQCPYCGKLIPKDSAMCPYCGGRLQGAPAEGIYPQQVPPQIQGQPQQQVPPPPMHSSYGQRPEVDVRSRYEPAPQPPSLSQQPKEGMEMQQKEIEDYKKSIKKLAKYIADKDNPNMLVSLGWKFADDEGKEMALLAAVIDVDRLYYCVDRLAPQHPDMAQQLATLKTPEGRDWIASALTIVKEHARKEGFKIPHERFAVLLKDIERKLGFEIPEQLPPKEQIPPKV